MLSGLKIRHPNVSRIWCWVIPGFHLESHTIKKIGAYGRVACIFVVLRNFSIPKLRRDGGTRLNGVPPDAPVELSHTFQAILTNLSRGGGDLESV
jgi:hypothetical protein